MVSRLEERQKNIHPTSDVSADSMPAWITPVAASGPSSGLVSCTEEYLRHVHRDYQEDLIGAMAKVLS
jgi:hypothetical protein